MKGKEYENLVKDILLKKHFQIIAENFRSPYGEIDLIASEDNRLIVIEVKGSGIKKVNPAEKLDCFKLKRILKTFEYFLYKFPQYSSWEFLFLLAVVKKNLKGELGVAFFKVDLDNCF